jgi:hypothetical protein
MTKSRKKFDAAFKAKIALLTECSSRSPLLWAERILREGSVAGCHIGSSPGLLAG